MTFSLTGRCDRTKRLGIVVATSSPTVGVRVPFISRFGAVTLQAVADPRRGARCLDLLEGGMMAKGVIEEYLKGDYHVGARQLAVIDADGHCEGYTGESNLSWAGHLVGKNCVALGNTIVGRIVLDAMVETFEDSAGLGLEERLMRAIEAGRDAGGQVEGQTSAALKSHEVSESWPRVDLRVDISEEPVLELRRMFEWYEPLSEYYAERIKTPNPQRYRDFVRSKGLARIYGRPVAATWVSSRQPE